MNRKSVGWFASALIVGGVAAIAYLCYRKSRSDGKDELGTHPYVNDPVDLYVEESFPASDSPGYNPISHIGRSR